MLRRFLQRFGLLPSPTVLEDAVRRQVVANFIVDLRAIAVDFGPWQIAADLGAPPDATIRQIAYLLVWTTGPSLRVFADVEAMDAVGLAIDAVVEGFDQYAAEEETARP